MVERSARFAAEAMEGAVIAGAGDAAWRGAAIDSRRVGGREIFFALEGERTDGHEFVTSAVERGAAAVVVHRDLDEVPAAAAIRVDDTYRALHALTRAVRREAPRRLVGITGSAGKTTTKDLLAAMLARRFRTEKSQGNFNNLYGFPLSLLNIGDDCEWMVAEMGMSTPGELRQVSLLGRPDAALYTNVRAVHLENFDGLRGIAEAKAELLAGLAPGGLVIANADDPEVMGIVERHGGGAGRVVRYGFDEPAEARGSDLAARPDGGVGSSFRLHWEGESRLIELRVHGLYNAENCLAAAACALALGVSLTDVAAAANAFEPSRMRGEVYRLAGLTLVDDSYNSNPDAATKALESARALAAERRVAVLGDMLELGAGSADFHRQVGERAAELGFRVVGVGKEARRLVEAATAAGAEARWLPDAAAAAAWAGEALATGELRPGDLVLVKGSRGVGLDAVVEAVRNADGGTSPGGSD